MLTGYYDVQDTTQSDGHGYGYYAPPGVTYNRKPTNEETEMLNTWTRMGELFRKNMENVENVENVGTGMTEEELFEQATNFSKDTLSRLSEARKKDNEIRAARYKLMREGSVFDQVLEKIRKGMYWLSDKIMDEIPLAGPYLKLQYLSDKFENLVGEPTPLFVGDCRNELDEIERVIDYSRETLEILSNDGINKGEEVDKVRSIIQSLNERKTKLENVLYQHIDQ
jgi:hypothetical protein